jgi:hypothetical protein
MNNFLFPIIQVQSNLLHNHVDELVGFCLPLPQAGFTQFSQGNNGLLMWKIKCGKLF